MSIAENLNEIRKTLPGGVHLVAVSKTRSAAEIMEAYRAGQRDFGENKVQEMAAKYQELPKDIRWHMIGHLQRNKVKYMAGFVHLVHGVDSLRLLEEINRRGAQEGRVIDCLLQVHIAEEETKFGFDPAELDALLQGTEPGLLKHVRIRGLMGMATFTEDRAQLHREFRSLKALFDRRFAGDPEADIRSMGMSGDYPIAVEEGSTMVRIGSSIFGSRA